MLKQSKFVSEMCGYDSSVLLTSVQSSEGRGGSTLQRKTAPGQHPLLPPNPHTIIAGPLHPSTKMSPSTLVLIIYIEGFCCIIMEMKERVI